MEGHREEIKQKAKKKKARWGAWLSDVNGYGEGFKRKEGHPILR